MVRGVNMDQPDITGNPLRPPLGGGPLWLHPDDDLAPNRPGETLLGRAEAAPPPPGRVGRLLGRGAADAAWRARLAGERRLGAALDAFAPLGWRVLHSIPLPGQDWVAHLAIGPGGVFGVRTASCPKARLRVDEDAVRYLRLGRPTRSEPEVRLCRRAARRAQHALTRGCGFPVEVRPVLALVGAARLERARALHDVRLLREADLGAFGALGGVLKPEVIETVYAVARDRRTWRDV
jgi:hypothetical protein